MVFGNVSVPRDKRYLGRSIMLLLLAVGAWNLGSNNTAMSLETQRLRCVSKPISRNVDREHVTNRVLRFYIGLMANVPYETWFAVENSLLKTKP